MSKTNSIRKGRSRFLLVRSMVVLLFVILGARLVFVQGILRAELSRKADRQLASHSPTTQSRRTIFDRNGLPLAETVQVYSCYLDPTKVKNMDQTIRVLSRTFKLNKDSLTKKIKKTRGSFLWIKRDISASDVASIKARNLNGVAFRLEERRHYPMGPIASHLLGLVGIDGSGLSGVEQKYNNVLNTRKKKSSNNNLPSGNLHLTIDGWIQQIVEKELDWAARKVKAKKGLVLIQSPDTGEILAMASWPPLTLDPDNPPSSKELLIPAVSDVFEPGSTFKIVVAAAAIEENLMKLNEKISGEKGAWKIADITIHDHEPRKMMSFDEVFVYSSNIGTAKIADRVGSERLYQYSRLFGFGVYPGSGLAGETKGMLRHPSAWSGISKNVISFGQEVGVNSAQLVGAYSAIANGGILMEPRLVKAIMSGDNKKLWESRPSRVRRVISLETSKKLTEILTKVVQDGTGKNAQIRWTKDYPVAGKTGTAQKFDRKLKRYCDDKTLVSFSGFFPANNPKLSMLVLLDEPEGRRWGGSDAAPLFRRIAEQLTTHMFL